jgi:inosine-uridine nucleoside N-ribohydrolase
LISWPAKKRETLISHYRFTSQFSEVVFLICVLNLVLVRDIEKRRIALTKRKIILDSDPGIDDAVAIAVLFKACKERVKLFLSSYGNTSIDNTTRNAGSVLSLLDADIPLVRGSLRPGPGSGTYVDASYIHGGDGIGGMQNSELLNKLQIKNAIEGDYLKIVYDFIIEEECVDYIALGPMTNLSALIRRFPDVVERINQTTIMGGGIKKGNITEFAEFNFHCDAESADHVLSVMPNITLTPLNITTQVAFDLTRIAEIGSAGTSAAAFMEAILTSNYHQCIAYGNTGSTMHDSTAVLAYLYPELFKFVSCGVRVNCGKERYGECVVSNDGNNVQLVTETNPQRLLDIIAESIT